MAAAAVTLGRGIVVSGGVATTVVGGRLSLLGLRAAVVGANRVRGGHVVAAVGRGLLLGGLLRRLLSGLVGGLLLGDLVLDLLVKRAHVRLGLGDLGVELVLLGLLVGEELLLLGLLGVEVVLDGLDLLDGLGVRLAHLGGVVHAAHEVVEAVGVEDDRRQRHAAGLVVGRHAAGEHRLRLFELALLLLDLGVSGIEVGLGLVDLLAHGGGLVVEVVQVRVRIVELGLELGRGVGQSQRGQAGERGRANHGRNAETRDGGSYRHGTSLSLAYRERQLRTLRPAAEVCEDSGCVWPAQGAGPGSIGLSHRNCRLNGSFYARVDQLDVEAP